ncbi:MAG: ferritin family protein [Theionarchaea archaeon]|nr:ferritin family protein [Theionarchaea archaeon]
MSTALELEQKGFHFYKESERRTKNETGKKIFSQLALEEEEHIKSLKEMFINLYPEKSGKAIPIFSGVVSEYSGEIEALQIAIEMEKESIHFYSEWAQEEFKSLFDQLIEFEKTHLELLQAELDYVQKNGFWFDYFESSQED